MTPDHFDRRQLLQAAATGAAGLWAASSGAAGTSGETSRRVRILDPFPGAVLSHRHGADTASGLMIHVVGAAPLSFRDRRILWLVTPRVYIGFVIGENRRGSMTCKRIGTRKITRP